MNTHRYGRAFNHYSGLPYGVNPNRIALASNELRGLLTNGEIPHEVFNEEEYRVRENYLNQRWYRTYHVRKDLFPGTSLPNAAVEFRSITTQLKNALVADGNRIRYIDRINLLISQLTDVKSQVYPLMILWYVYFIIN